MLPAPPDPTSMNTFLKFLDKVTPMVFNSNSRIILCSKSEQFKNTEPRKKLDILHEKGVHNTYLDIKLC